MVKDGIEQLVRDLSGQLSGLATELSRQADRIAADGSEPGRVPDQAELLARCRRVREQRRRRNAYFPPELFHEPAWDMLLTLYVARVERRTMYVKTLVLAADAPITTSQRWIEQLFRLGMVERTEDAADRRRIEVALTDAAAAAIERYLIDLP